MRSDIIVRRPNERYVWKLHRYVGRAKVVSHRASAMPIESLSGKKSSLRQAVVEIRSVQSLERIDPLGNIEAVAPKGKEITEYVVIQKRIWKEEEEPWRIWGTTVATNLNKMDEIMHPKIVEAN